jgi:DNA-binding NtrC family response regulator
MKKKRNCLESAVSDLMLKKAELPNKLKMIPLQEVVLDMDRFDFKDFKYQCEYIYLSYHLQQNNFNVSQTAEQIGIQRSHLYNKMELFNIQRT